MSLNSKKSKYNLCPLTFITVLGVLLTPVAISKCLAFTEIADINDPVLFKPPPEEKQPKDTEGAGSRGESSHHDEIYFPDVHISKQQKANAERLHLTAVTPGQYRFTVAERPTFWFYLPKTSAQKIIFSIGKKGSNPHWQKSINLTGETGIIGIKLSDDAPALEIGKQYQWKIVLVYDDRTNPETPVVTDWIRRVDESEVIDSQSPAKTYVKQRLVREGQMSLW